MIGARVTPQTPGISRTARLRAYLAGAVITLGIVGVGYKAWALQVKNGAHYRDEATHQHTMNVEIPAPRGAIIDAQGRPLAASADADSVWASPKDVHDVAATASKLAALVGGDQKLIESRLSTGKRFAWIARQVTPQIAAAVRAAKLPGIEVSREPRRWYPGKSSGGPVVGMANIDGQGLDGIELSMDAVLTGKRAEASALRDAHGHTMMSDGLIESQAGATVQLTLDRTIQSIADQAIADAVTAHSAKSGMVVVLDVATSNVLALASYPTYDPNAPEGGGSHATARDLPVDNSYELGSVMKLFTVSTALDDGATNPSETWNIHGGVLQIGTQTIHDVEHNDMLTTSEIIKYSSNVGAAEIAMRLGAEKLYNGFSRFGFGKRTGIELPGEQMGMMRNWVNWRDVELRTIAFGMGITATPLQLAAALSAIGNHGVYHEPRIVSKVTDESGKVIYAPQPESHQAIKPATAAMMLPILASVFDPTVGKVLGGTAKAVKVPGFKAGGKTGTAPKFDVTTHHYSTDRYMSSFAGLAPIDNPRIAVIVVVDEPSAANGDYYGGTVSAPTFGIIASQALRYLGVPGNAIEATPTKGSAVTAKANDAADDDHPHSDAHDMPVSDEAADPSVPSFLGMGARRVLDRAKAAGVLVAMTGSGRVVEQTSTVDNATGKSIIQLKLSSEIAHHHAAPVLPAPAK